MSDESKKYLKESFSNLGQALKDVAVVFKDAYRHIKGEDLSNEYAHLIFEVTPGYLDTVAEMFGVPEEHKMKCTNLSIGCRRIKRSAPSPISPVGARRKN